MNIKQIAAIALSLAGTVSVSAQDISKVKELLNQMQNEVHQLEQQTATQEAIQTRPMPVESLPDTNGIIALDTLTTVNEAVKIIIYNDNTWKYLRDKEFVKDSEIYTKFWDTNSLLPYREISLASLPNSVAIDLVDSLKCYHYPIKGTIRSKYGPRHRRNHHGVDIPLKMGDPVYATFNGRVRISDVHRGYGNLIIIRHDNGLETYYGHLSERLVQSGDWVEAGQVVGYGGSTGRSTGPHLHFEARYYGQSFDPERLIDFASGNLRRETFLLKKSFFNIHSNAGQDFDDEEALEKEGSNDTKQQVAATKTTTAATYHKVRSGDTLGKIAAKYGTTVSKLCSLNNISKTTILSLNRNLRVR